MKKTALSFCLLLTTSLPVYSLELVTSIKPLQLMALELILSEDQVDYLIPPHASPHTYGLKPSAIKQAREADLLIWVGMESKWEKLFINLDSSIELAHALGLQEEEEDHANEEEHSHHDHSIDLHIWLSPPLIRQAATIITDRLIQLNPSQAKSYREKLASFERELSITIDAINNSLLSVRDKKFYTMHDAFGYFISYFHLSNSGYLTLSPEIPLSASRLQRIRSDLKNNNIACIFSEPQLDETAALKLIEGTQVRHGILDPLAGNIEEKSKGYFDFLRSLAESFKQCLAS